MVQDPASADAAKPAIVIVPGSFSPASFYTNVVDALHAHGYEAIVETLLSSSRSPLNDERAATMEEDADLFRQIVQDLADQGKDVVIVTHSYGGVPGTECSRELSKATRRAIGKQGGISRFVYVTSVVPTPGHSLKDLMGDLVPSFLQVEVSKRVFLATATFGFLALFSGMALSNWLTDFFCVGTNQGDFMSHVIEESAKLTFSDLPFEEAKEWVKRMPYHSAASFDGKLTYPGYNHIPVSFVICEKDVILPPEFQHSVIDGIERESGKKVDVHTLNTGHCPNASAPEDLASVIIKAVVTAA
ncbi:uncharacterized protein A1O5_08887 [Cladophialophora psammophila CBS 110553]|uniref:AB hydrolase-1 domain-containing protein n=1 Tax=Cladophialophora psammophila CBS 110553 TaxID=1182543 RepID=W9WJG7_9EURO|nr:uncharacterized protein A1O5_08887 [Cladophialophora psammophila CBS 110553]EXJ68272.1 hypothetical protein A1O5_08887 [Cladophialophora psammophila CBS 110553]